MKLNIINLIDNFKKFNNNAIIQVPGSSHSQTHLDFQYCTEIFENCQCYLIFEQQPFGAVKLFNILLEKGRNGIIITRNHPDQLFQNFLSKKIDMYWLSSEDFDYVIHPWETTQLFRKVEKFINRNNQGIILINGIEYLSTYNDPNIILNLIFRMNKLVTETEAKFLLTIDPIAVGKQFLNNIENHSEISILPSNPIKEVLNWTETKSVKMNDSKYT